jgi:hypothetical protein
MLFLRILNLKDEILPIAEELIDFYSYFLLLFIDSLSFPAEVFNTVIDIF